MSNLCFGRNLKKLFVVGTLTGALVSTASVNVFGMEKIAAGVTIAAEAPKAARNIANAAQKTQNAATNFSRKHPIATTSGMIATGGAAVGAAVGGAAGAAVGAAAGAVVGAVMGVVEQW